MGAIIVKRLDWNIDRLLHCDKLSGVVQNGVIARGRRFVVPRVSMTSPTRRDQPNLILSVRSFDRRPRTAFPFLARPSITQEIVQSTLQANHYPRRPMINALHKTY
jgi:hypothetical protein